MVSGHQTESVPNPEDECENIESTEATVLALVTFSELE